ncbi:hypothetical protein [Pseudonocardia phyllosphaerae]|uniref:hypothetical protein n=1 Tax=Pseudonocardia phyllosphaerae TaxID=3390502 RepID=UPI00397C84C0
MCADLFRDPDELDRLARATRDLAGELVPGTAGPYDGPRRIADELHAAADAMSRAATAARAADDTARTGFRLLPDLPGPRILP